MHVYHHYRNGESDVERRKRLKLQYTRECLAVNVGMVVDRYG